jgi:hypothetical protein
MNNSSITIEQVKKYLEYLNEYYKYLDTDTAPNKYDAMMFKFAMRYMPIIRIDTDFDKEIRAAFDRSITKLGNTISTMEKEERINVQTSDADRDFSKAISFANDVYGCWAIRNQYQYLINS